MFVESHLQASVNYRKVHSVCTYIMGSHSVCTYTLNVLYICVVNTGQKMVR